MVMYKVILPLGFPDGVRGKKSTCQCRRQDRIHGFSSWVLWIQFLGREDLLEEGMATHSSILAWRIQWTKETGRLQSTGSKSWTRLKQLSMHTCILPLRNFFLNPNWQFYYKMHLTFQKHTLSMGQFSSKTIYQSEQFKKNNTSQPIKWAEFINVSNKDKLLEATGQC